MGDIVAVRGFDDIAIGDTLCDVDHAEPLPFVKIEDPTVTMTFSVNNSPMAGREGQFVTSRHLRARLFKEMQTDVSLRVEDTETTEAFKRIRPRRAASVHTDRNHAPSGLRVPSV